VQHMRLKREAEAIRLGMKQTFKAAYPNETVISSDPQAQMRANINRAKAASGQVTPDEFIFLAAAFGEAARSLPRPPALISMAFRERVLTIKAKPESIDPQTVVTLKQALVARGLALEDTMIGVWSVRSTGVKKMGGVK